MKKIIKVSDEMKEAIQDLIYNQVEIAYIEKKYDLIKAKMIIQTEKEGGPILKWVINDEGVILGIYNKSLLSEKEVTEMNEDYNTKMSRLAVQMGKNR